VEDTPDIALWLGTALRQGGMAVQFATDGLQANQCLQAGHGFDAVLLDLQLPGQDGLSVLQALRGRGDAVPVLVLTARASVPDRVLGLNLGADDYLPKPFYMEELIVRVKALINNKRGKVEMTLVQGDLALDRFTRVATWQGEKATLTQREYVLLECLMMSPGQIFSREQILKQVWNVDFDPGTNVVDVSVQRLRKKLSSPKPDSPIAFPIETIRGVGYRFKAQA
jgi:two-component system response regulator TctD